MPRINKKKAENILNKQFDNASLSIMNIIGKHNASKSKIFSVSSENDIKKVLCMLKCELLEELTKRKTVDDYFAKEYKNKYILPTEEIENNDGKKKKRKSRRKSK